MNDEWYFDCDKAINNILKNQGKNKKNLIDLILVSVFFSIIYFAYKSKIVIIAFFMFTSSWAFFSDVFEHYPFLKNIKTKISVCVVAFSTWIIFYLLKILKLFKWLLERLNLNGISYAPENIILFAQMSIYWILPFQILFSKEIDKPFKIVILLVSLIGVKCLQYFTIKFSFKLNSEAYKRWKFENDFWKIEKFIIVVLIGFKSLASIFGNTDLSEALLSIIIINGFYNILNYIKNNFNSYSIEQKYFLSVVLDLEQILLLIDCYNIEIHNAKLNVKPYFLCFKPTKKTQFLGNEVLMLCFNSSKNINKENCRRYNSQKEFKENILKTLNIICNSKLI